MGENSGDEVHRAGPGERSTVEQHASEEQEATENVTTDEVGGEVGEAIHRAADAADEPAERDAEAGGEIGDAIRREAEES